MSRYIFEGNLHALICSECRESVGGAQILLYRHLGTQDVDELIAARPMRLQIAPHISHV